MISTIICHVQLIAIAQIELHTNLNNDPFFSTLKFQYCTYTILLKNMGFSEDIDFLDIYFPSMGINLCKMVKVFFCRVIMIFLFAWKFANIIINGEAHLSFFECNCKISSQQYTTTTQLLLYEIHAAVPSYALYWYVLNIVIDVNLKNELKYSIFKRILSRCCTLLCWKWKCIWWMH